MVYRKGELNNAKIDRDWPHQVALTAEFVQGRNCTIIDRFNRGLSICTRQQRFHCDGVEYLAYCFAEPLDAQYFQTLFGGEIVDPKDRPKPGARGRFQRG
jgi:hypothetical protein